MVRDFLHPLAFWRLCLGFLHNCAVEVLGFGFWGVVLVGFEKVPSAALGEGIDGARP